MKAWIGVTDRDWYELLAGEPGIDEVDFWQPGGTRPFRVLEPGELFLFKLHAPENFVVGGGFFAHWTRLPVSLAWESFGLKNGARSLAEMRARIERYRRGPARDREDVEIGCILLEQPFFLPRERWIAVPSDWRPQIVQGKGYDFGTGEGRALWERLRAALGPSAAATAEWPAQFGVPPAPRYGEPTLVAPRLGQGSFRVLVTDAYERRCGISGERVLPVLQAAHIKPYAQGGYHRVDNGILLRSDLHTLFDRGYVTVTPDLHVEVSRRIHDDWENGREYLALHGRELRAPRTPAQKPAGEWLRWHNEEVYRG